MNLVCEICKNEIAEIGELREPIQGSMFKGLAPHLPNPFHPMQPWVHMKCPYCYHRPMIREDRMLVRDEELFGTDFRIIHIEEAVSLDCEDQPRPDMPEPGSEPKDVEADPTGDPSDEPDQPPEEAETVEITPETVDAKFDSYIEDGTIKKHSGGWYEYDGKNYRREKAIELIIKEMENEKEV